MVKYILLCALVVYISTGAFAQCGCSGSSSSVSFGETGSASLTLDRNQWQLEAYGEYSSFKQASTHHHSTNMVMLQNTSTVVAGISYGLTDRISLSLKQPDVWLHATSQSINGLGDLQLISTIGFLDKNNFTGAFLAGVEFPSGKKSSFANEANLAIGSGSFDPLGGIMIVKSFSKSLIRANAFYKQGTRGYDKTNFGSFFSHNLTYSYKLKEAKESCASDSVKTENKNFSWIAFASASGEWSSEQVKENIMLENTGGYSLFFQAGTLFGFEKWSIPVTFAIPLMQDLKGEQSQIHFRTRIGIVKTF